ncbi:MAG: hypothetical protein AB8B62_15200 [Roseobacter sp.]
MYIRVAEQGEAIEFYKMLIVLEYRLAEHAAKDGKGPAFGATELLFAAIRPSFEKCIAVAGLHDLYRHKTQ